MSDPSLTARRGLIWLIVLALAAVLVLPSHSTSASSDGDLDASFGGNGWNTISGTDLWFEAASVVVQSSGKVVAAGARMNGFQFDPLIARFNTDGSLDTTFGSDGTGIVVEPWPDGETIMEWVNRSGAAVDVALLSDDRIVVTSSPSGDNEKHGIMLFTADGVLDTSFDGDGRRKIASGGPNMDVWTTAVTVTSDDKIMIVGTSPDNSWDYRMKVYRLNTDGSNDTSFNNDGMRNVSFPSSVDNLANAVVMSGDKTIFGGSAADSWSRHDMGIGQLTSDGRNDTTFASGSGRTYVDFGFGDSDVRELLVQADGKIVAIGESQVFDNDDSVAVTRLNADGSLDTSFSGDGKFAHDFGNGDSYGWAGAIDEDGRIVIAGQYNNGANDKAFVMRLTTAGELDTSFGTGGIKTFDFVADHDETFNAIAVLGGDMVVAGGSGSDLLVARLTDLYSLGDLDGITEIDGNFVNPNQIVLTEDALASYNTPLEPCGQLTFTLADGIPPTIGILTPDGAARAASYDPDTHTLGVTDSVSSSQPGFNFAWRSQWALRFVVFGGWIGGSGEKHALTGWTDNNNITAPEGTNYAPVEFALDYGVDGYLRLYGDDALLKASANTFSGDQTLHIAGFDDQQQSELYIPTNWTLTGPAELDITYDSQNGSNITDGDATTDACGAIATLPTDPTRDGYTFTGWFTAASGGSEITAGAAHGQDADFTLYAQWSADTLGVTYNSQGGSNVTDGDATTTTGGSIATLPTDPTRDGYTFTGWFTAASGGSEITAGADHGQTGDFTLYAQWTANTLDVVYDSQGGSDVTGGDVTTTTGGAIAALPTDPTRDGYTFTGWFTAASGGSEITAGAAHGQDADFTLYAQWSADTLDVIYDSQGGSNVTDGDATTTTDGSIATLPTAPTRTGYTFNGWFTAASDGTEITAGAAHNQTGDFTLYAQWQINTVTLAYDTRGGTGQPNAHVASAGSAVTVSSVVPTRAGYTFECWNSQADGSGADYYGGDLYTLPYSGTDTLYALWQTDQLIHRNANSLVPAVRLGPQPCAAHWFWPSLWTGC